MTEILTESFCERCGTRYTFESARPRVRLKGVKVLSRGLKNFVLSDDTSIDEAMAAARSEADREASAHQLDAFHKTFNFCMSCRQYTCPNCWNEAEARCLSCAPLALPEVTAAVDDLRELRQAVLTGEPAPGNGTVALDVEEQHEPWVAAATPEGLAADRRGVEVEPAIGVEPAAEEAAPILAEAAEAAEVVEDVEDVVAPEEFVAPAELLAPEELVAAEELATEEHDEEGPIVAEAIEPPTEDLSAAEAVESPAESGAADKAVSQTLGLLRRFRPGQSLDAELDAFERERVDAAATNARAETEAAAEPTPPIGDLATLQDERAPAAADVADKEALELEPATEPATEAPAQPAAPPIAAAAADDVVEQPTWRITAPDPTGTVAGGPQADQVGSVPLQAGSATPRPAAGEPQWPARPEWPAASATAAGLPFLGRPAAPEGGMDALWAASNQELVTATPAPGKATSGIQPCISCGLSLSATARFCRRCGTLQGR